MAKSNTGEVSEKLISPIGRVCFPAVFARKKFKNDAADKEGKYGVILVFDRKAQKTAEFKKLVKAVAAVAEVKFGKEAVKGDMDEKQYDLLNRKLSNPIRSGKDYADEYGDPFDAKGAIFVAFRTTNKPGVIDEERDDITDEDGFYAGCYARVSYVARAFDTAGNKGVHMLLNNVQKMKDGERLDNRGDASDDFEEGKDEDEDDLVG